MSVDKWEITRESEREKKHERVSHLNSSLQIEIMLIGLKRDRRKAVSKCAVIRNNCGKSWHFPVVTLQRRSFSIAIGNTTLLTERQFAKNQMN